MENGEGGGGSAHGCAGGAQEQGAQEQTDLAEAKERLFEHMRLLGEQHAVIVWCFAMV